MRLISVDPANETHLKVLYELLSERLPEQNISHREMPTWEEHCRFVTSKPYRDWCFIDGVALSRAVGAAYLTNANEIGIFVFDGFKGIGVGPAAVRMMMEKHGLKKAIANVNPANQPSIAMFEKKFNAKLIQFTYELEYPGAH